jgi:hypothetical protein
MRSSRTEGDDIPLKPDALRKARSSRTSTGARAPARSRRRCQPRTPWAVGFARRSSAAPTRHLPPLHRRRAHPRPGGLEVRVEARRLGSARRRCRRGAHHRVRRADDRRQLRLLQGGPGSHASGISDRRDARGRELRDHQAPRHGRARLGRHRDGPAAVRDRGPLYPNPDVTARHTIQVSKRS